MRHFVCGLKFGIKETVMASGPTNFLQAVQVTSHFVLACVRRPPGTQRLVAWPCCIGHVRQSG
jgi:hypothetical protein